MKQIIDKKIQKKILVMGADLIKGLKWCGKTTSAKQFVKSILKMQNSDLQQNYIELVNTRPSLLLEDNRLSLIK